MTPSLWRDRYITLFLSHLGLIRYLALTLASICIHDRTVSNRLGNSM